MSMINCIGIRQRVKAYNRYCHIRIIDVSGDKKSMYNPNRSPKAVIEQGIPLVSIQKCLSVPATIYHRSGRRNCFALEIQPKACATWVAHYY